VENEVDARAFRAAFEGVEDDLVVAALGVGFSDRVDPVDSAAIGGGEGGRKCEGPV